MSQKRKTQKLPKLQFRAEFAPESLDLEKRTVDVTWTTGYKGLRQAMFGNYYEELSLDPQHVRMDHLKSGRAKFLAAHDMRSLDSVIGVIESADIGSARIRFANDDISTRNLQKIKDGILTDISVGYRVDEYMDVSKEGDETPTYRAVNWTPMEISLVPMGFDPGAVVRSENENENEVEIITRSNPTITEVQSMDEIEKKRLEQEKLENAKQEAAKAERTRVSEIRKAVKAASLADSLADGYIERGTSVEEAKVNIEMFAKYAKEQEATRVSTVQSVEVGQSDIEKKREGIIESLLHRADPNQFKLTSGNQFSGMSMLRALEEAGIVKRTVGMTDTLVARAAMSSSDLPYILANVAEKSAQAKYNLQPRTWSRWAKTDTLRNFKQADRVRSGDFASLEERQESGAFKRGSFGEEREQVQLKEYGKTLAFTRRMLINDDLGEVLKVAAQSGVAASRLENRLVYGVLTANAAMGDGTALFHADHNNLGSAAAITDTTIGEAFKLMRKQTTVDALDHLNLAPKYLICGPDNEVAARKYLAQISPTQASNVNVFSSSLELIVDAEISNDDYFFAADQNAIDTVVLFHLEGEESPRVETRIDFGSEELEIKVAHSAVAQAMDHRGLVKNAGAT